MEKENVLEQENNKSILIHDLLKIYKGDKIESLSRDDVVSISNNIHMEMAYLEKHINEKEYWLYLNSVKILKAFKSAALPIFNEYQYDDSVDEPIIAELTDIKTDTRYHIVLIENNEKEDTNKFELWHYEKELWLYDGTIENGIISDHE